MEKNNIFDGAEVIYAYTSKEAENDGFLVDITQINPNWKKGIFNFVTTNLLEKGYLTEEKLNLPNVLDLLNQAIHIVKIRSNGFTKFDHFFSGLVELPSGVKTKVFIVQNETGKFTIMLPEDY